MPLQMMQFFLVTAMHHISLDHSLFVGHHYTSFRFQETATQRIRA